MFYANYNEFAEIFAVFLRCWHPGVGTLEHTCHRILFNPVHMKKIMNERKKERNLDFSGSRQLAVVKL
jgi:hypothetical protein